MYYNNKLKDFEHKSSEISLQLNGLPKDRIKDLYEGLKYKFVENYQVNTDRYSIPKEEEQEFLKDFPRAKHLKIYPKGYSHFKTNSISIDGQKIKYYDVAQLGKKIKRKFSAYADIPDEQLGQKILKKYPPQSDTAIVIDYVELSKFRISFKNKEFRDILFSSFSDRYDLGTPTEIERKIQEGLKYTNETKILQDSLEKEKSQILATIKQEELKNLNSSSILNIVAWTGLIFAIILYPLRLCYLLIKWSIVTLKKNTM